jgi:hypothetical protein
MVKVPRDVKAAFPHRCTACAKLISDRTGRTWSNNDVAQVATFLKVKEADNEHHYGFGYGKSTFHQYSDSFIDLIVQRLQQEPDLVKHAREATRRRSK